MQSDGDFGRVDFERRLGRAKGGRPARLRPTGSPFTTTPASRTRTACGFDPGKRGQATMMRIKTIIVSLFMCSALGLAGTTHANPGIIQLEMEGTGFYVSARCYGGGYYDNWTTNMAVLQEKTCGNASEGTGSEYIRINRRTLFFKNFGSTWRIYRKDHCPSPLYYPDAEVHYMMTVTVKGHSKKSSRYSVDCEYGYFIER